MLGLDTSKEAMSNDTPTLKKADEEMDFLLNQGRLTFALTFAYNKLNYRLSSQNNS